MKIMMSKNSEKEGQAFVGEITKTESEGSRMNFSGGYEVDAVDIRVEAVFDDSNCKGNLKIFMDGKPFINSLVSIDPTHLLVFKINDESWVEINVSK